LPKNPAKMVHGTGFTVHDSVETQCIASLQDAAPPLGVASTLRRAKSKAPALHYRAESPVISSTGQRPVGINMSRQPALKGRNPAIDSMPPFQGYGKEIAFIHRALPCANDLRAFSPELFTTPCRDAACHVSTQCTIHHYTIQ
jgi:hypothetical protein